MTEATQSGRGERTMVFIDGQNLYKGLQKRFGTRLHPILLSQILVGQSRTLAGAFYYSGIHDPAENPAMHNIVRRRHDLIRSTGVAVTERTLRYRWEWRVDRRRLRPPWDDDAPDKVTATVYKHRSTREKGIDVALALDAVSSLLAHDCDTAVIVSRDRDLMEIASEIKQRCGDQSKRVEVAYVRERHGDEKALRDYDDYLEIDDDVVAACRDDFDYRYPLDTSTVQEFLANLSA